ncbi:uncharacterized protein HMPREF1541_01078 [Cyphellophora europaea CBS 101466]|uniref:MAGE domain-containing protein n=1 Tax=Cyphellophora europaea (strain CBS 101466) TaxID=1220924 RepID=W2SG97_CYPE1|nr:uncharacterized protein HMPREF1541_01078 [Cyphellophora europaea CBS 101466]ETN46889.1 hypothetical protein HMPREF1541_01078 [Cyphellophora europaea CBS 101466]
MPRINRKRRSDAISRDASPSDPPNPPPSRSRQRSSSSEPSESTHSPDAGGADDDDHSSETQADAQRKSLVKKLVRLALATEYSRTPLRRTDITAKVFKDAAGNNVAAGPHGGRSSGFKQVFDDAQKVLQGTFGMELRELPSREKTTLKERRTQATQQSAGKGGGGGGSAGANHRGYILVSVLPRPYQESVPVLGVPNRAPSQEAEAGYVAFYSFVVALVYLNDGEVAEQKLERYLRRVNAEMQTPFGTLEKVKARMVREGYLERKKEQAGGEEVVSFTVGPRGKMEVGRKGVEGLVRSVYGLGAAGDNGDGPKIEDAELAKRLQRSLGVRGEVLGGEDGDGVPPSAGGSGRQSRNESRNGTPQPRTQQQQQQQPRRRGRPRRAARDDDDVDD